jgi:hypothetical protein
MHIWCCHYQPPHSGIVAAIARLVIFLNAEAFFKDPTFHSITTFSWVMAEGGTYLIAACLPTMRPLKRRLFPRLTFTGLLESVIQVASGKSSRTHFFRTSKKGESKEPQKPRIEKRDGTLESLELQSASTVRLNDVDTLCWIVSPIRRLKTPPCPTVCKTLRSFCIRNSEPRAYQYMRPYCELGSHAFLHR